MKTDTRGVLRDALKMLGRRDFFRDELRKRLCRKEHPATEVDEALDRCQEMGYLNDQRLARRFAEIRATQRGWGPGRIHHELGSRGVDAAVVDECAELPVEIVEQAIAVALKRAEIRARQGWWRAGEGRARMVSSLLRRGFQPEHAHREVARLAAERAREEKTW